MAVENSPMGKGKKRKYEEDSPKTRKMRVLGSTDSSDLDGSIASVSSKSFYGSSKKKYITPLERRDINILREKEDGNVKLAVASPKILSNLKSTTKRSPSPARQRTVKRKTKSMSTPKTKEDAKDNVISKQPVVPAPAKNESNKSGKKFFKNSSPRKKARRMGMSICITKGVNVTYQPSGPKKKLATPKKAMVLGKRDKSIAMKANMEYTPTKKKGQNIANSNNDLDTPSKKNISTPSKMVKTPSKMIKTPSKMIKTPSKLVKTPSKTVSTPVRRNTPRSTRTPSKAVDITRTPKQLRLDKEDVQNDSASEMMDPSQDLFSTQEEFDSGMGKLAEEDTEEEEEYQMKMFESPVKSRTATPVRSSSTITDLSVSPDSVMLISDIGSDYSPNSSRTSSKKLFPIFAKGSPAVRSSPRHSTASSPHTPGSQRLLSQTGGSSSKKRRSPTNLLRRIKDSAANSKDRREQMMLDFGQKRIGATQCETCGMTYSLAEPADEAMHIKFHQRRINVLKFPGWKKENVIQENLDGSRIIMVTPDDKQASKKIEQIKQIVDEDLGFVVEAGYVMPNTKTFLYISDDKRVVGCCVAQYINEAFRVLAAPSEDSQRVSGRPWCCSTHPEPARAGINRIWVLQSHRRRNIATILLDAVRYSFMMGYPLSKSDLAFSDPTPDGMNLATNYTGTSTFLVYKKPLPK